MDNLTRDMIQSGELKLRMVVSVGLPLTAIFEKAMMGNAIYDAPILKLESRAGLPTYKIYEC